MKKSILFISFMLLVCSLPINTFGECIKGDCKNGQGTYTYPDGSKYVGGYKNDRRHGQGTYTYPDGRKYVGGWKYDNQHGQGTETFTDGRKHVGEFRKGKYVDK